jgi:hypothetical protein
MGHAHSLELKSASSRLVKRAVTSAILISLVANGSFASKAQQQPRKSNSGSDSGGFWGAVDSVLDFATSGGGGHSDRSAGARREVSRRDGREYQVVVRSWKEANGRFGSGFFSKEHNEFVHRVESRGTEPNYGTNFNNRRFRRPVEPQRPPAIPPPSSPSPGSWAPGANWNGWRVGYTGYSENFVDDLFTFGYYVFQPGDDSNCEPSPLYCYPNLPPYIEGDRIDPVSDVTPGFSSTVTTAPDGTTTTTTVSNSKADRTVTILVQKRNGEKKFFYRDGSGDVVKPRGHVLDAPVAEKVRVLPAQHGDFNDKDALKDLKACWEKGDGEAIDRLIPRSGFVSVSVGDRHYQLTARDFFDLFHDGIDDTKTIAFVVTEEIQNGNQIKLTVKHDYTDPSGKPRSVTQRYTLVKESVGYMIRSFEADPYQEPPAIPAK